MLKNKEEALIGMAVMVVAIIATLGIWYFLANDTFENMAFDREQGSWSSSEEKGRDLMIVELSRDQESSVEKLLDEFKEMPDWEFFEIKKQIFKIFDRRQ